MKTGEFGDAGGGEGEDKCAYTHMQQVRWNKVEFPRETSVRTHENDKLLPASLLLRRCRPEISKGAETRTRRFAFSSDLLTGWRKSLAIIRNSRLTRHPRCRLLNSREIERISRTMTRHGFPLALAFVGTRINRVWRSFGA